MVTAHSVKPATDKQVNLICKLAAEKDWTDLPTTFDTVFDIVNQAGKTYSTREASAAIDELFNAPRLPKEAGEAIEAGFYTLDGEVYKVQMSKAGNAYAKVLGKREFINADGEPEWDLWFDYAPGAAARLTPANKMTEEEAKEFGRFYSKCVRCHRKLSRADSIERMMGAVCYRKMFG